MKQKSFIYVTFQKEGYHCFPEAGNDERYATGDYYDVSHLANKHMHYFFFKVWVEVNHNNRDIEFIQFRRWLESLYQTNTLQLNNSSCEMICENLYKEISAKYPNLDVKIEVSEDGINGAYVEFLQ
jgi:hypothetical protein